MIKKFNDFTNDVKVNQFGVRQYMNANHPDENTFVSDFTPFEYNGVKFYPVASRPRHGFNKIDRQIDFNNEWFKSFSESLNYDYDSFYDEAKKYGYENCDVFACLNSENGNILYLIPTTYTFASFPLAVKSRGIVETQLRTILEQ